MTALVDQLLEATVVPRQSDQLFKEQERQRLAHEAVMVRMLSRAFSLLGQRVRVVAEEHTDGLVVEADSPSAAEHQAVEHVLSASALSEFTTRYLQPIFESNAGLVAKVQVRMLERADFPVSLRSQLARQLIATGGKRVGLLDVKGDTRQALFRVLEQARAEDLNPRAAARLIEEFVPEGRFVNAGSSYRASMIARTEIMHAQRNSMIQLTREMPGYLLRAYDGDEDEICAGRDGELFAPDDAEIEMNNEHPNGTLTFAPERA